MLPDMACSQGNECERWLQYRDYRNNAAHRYGEEYANEVLAALPAFIEDARALSLGHSTGDVSDAAARPEDQAQEAAGVPAALCTCLAWRCGRTEAGSTVWATTGAIWTSRSEARAWTR